MRSAGAVTDTGLYDWSKYPHIYDDYKKGDASKWGIFANPQERSAGCRSNDGAGSGASYCCRR